MQATMRLEGNFGRFLERGEADKVALVDVGAAPPGSVREVTYAALLEAARGVAARLRRRGLKAGDAVAQLGVNSAEYFAAHVGIMLAGMVSVPVNHRFPPAQVAFVLRDCGAKLALCDRAMAGTVPDGLSAEALDGALDGWRADAGGFGGAEDVDGEATALVLYTSGSTGRPKGVPLSHASQNWVVGTRLAAGEISAHRLLVAAPMYHMNALAVTHFALAGNATVVLLPRFTAAAYIEAAERHRCSWLTSVPTMMAMVLQEAELLARADLSSVKAVRMGSAPVTRVLLDGLAARLPGVQLTAGYGTTESGPVAFGPHPDGLPVPPMALGCPHPAVDLRLIGPDGTEADEGVLELRCPAVMRGYLNLPEKSAEVLTADGYYVTGDVMRRDRDGFHYFVGRVDDMFVCGGENVYPGEVELMLERHPAVAQACVLPVPDPIKGAKPVAAVVARPGHSPDEAELRRFALANGPAYMHPRRVFVLPELPLSGTNKIDRQAVWALLEPALAAPPEEAEVVTGS